jgi:hypothetical protein
MSLSTLLLSALFAGVVAIGVTVAVERLGGLLGGLVGTLPTTIVPAALGIHATASEHAFELAMYAVAPAMFLNALFLLVWGALPPRLPSWSVAARLCTTLVVSLSLWGAGALGLVLVLRPRVTVITAIAATLGLASAGIVATARTASTPRAKRRVSPIVLLARGTMAAVAIGGAVALSAMGGDVSAGVASVFPAIFLTTMVGLWLSHGETVPIGATGPMMVGSTSVAAYALVASMTLPTLGAWAGSAVAWILVAVMVQLPLFFIARAVVGRLR